MKELKEFVKIFPHQIFGDLTIIKSRVEDDTYWFVGKEIQEILGFQDLSQAISKGAEWSPNIREAQNVIMSKLGL